MKQIINKEDKAVSPIIATILLIAITVVLAATLYTVLGGFTKGLSSSGSASLSGSFVNSTTSSTTYSYNFSVASSSSGGISISSLELRITNVTGSNTSGALKNGINSIGPYSISISGLSGNNVVAGTTFTITVNSTIPTSSSFHAGASQGITQISIIDTSSNSVIYTS